MPSVEALTTTVEVPEVPRLTVAGLSDAVRPVAGETDDESATVPVKPPRLVTVIVEVSEEPRPRVIVFVDADILKSTTLTITLAEWETMLLVPVTVTV